MSVRESALETVQSLCKWIQDRCEKGASGEELAILPEVVKATAQLIEATK